MMSIIAMIAIGLVSGAGASRPNRYDRSSSLFEWGDIGLSGRIDTGSRVVAFADVNGDKKVDLIILSGSQQRLQVHLWSAQLYQFELSSTMTITVDDIIISGVAPADFNQDGIVDLLVQGRASNDDHEVVGRVFLFDKNTTSFVSHESVVSDDELLVFDYDADMKLDLFGFSGGERKAWVNDGHGSFTPIDIPAMRGRTAVSHPLGRPHSYLDLNGDCIADLVVATDANELEVYVWDQDVANWQFAHIIKLAPSSGPVTFVDANNDGNMDLIYTSGTSSIVIHYNVQKVLCTSSASTSCRPAHDLCSVDEYFRFDSFSDVATSPNISTTHLRQTLQPNALIHTGDINADGRPELLLVRSDGYVLMLSCRVEGGVVVVAEDRISSPLMTVPTAVAAAFFDVNEDGLQDVLVMDRSVLPVKFFLNNLNEDNFFFKTLVSNGVCSEWCPSPSYKFPLPKPYGVNQPGVTVKFTVASTTGVRRQVSGAQLSQSSYRSLQLPYVFAGLARTFSYIEHFSIGISTGAVGTWTSMIPNSQLVVFPYPPHLPAYWVVELFLNPTSNWLWIAVSVLFTSVALLAAIVMLHWRHLKADLILQRKAERFFTF